MSFEKILYKLRDAWRGDIKQSLEGLPGYYWGEVTGPGEVLLDAAAPGSAPVPVDDLVGTLVGDRVLLVLVDGAFSVVGVSGGLLRTQTFTSALSGQFSLNLGAGVVLQKVVYSGPSRLRLYRTAVGRGWDMTRGWDEPYSPASRRTLLYDFLAEGPVTDLERPVLLSPEPGADTIYGIVSSPVTVELTYSIIAKDQ